MTIKEVALAIINGRMTCKRGAEVLQKSERSIRRYVKTLKENPNETFVHKNTGRIPANKKDGSDIVKLYLTKYKGLNICKFCRALKEYEDISVSHTYVRTLLRKHSIISPLAWRSTKEDIAINLSNRRNLTPSEERLLDELKKDSSLFDPFF